MLKLCQGNHEDEDVYCARITRFALSSKQGMNAFRRYFGKTYFIKFDNERVRLKLKTVPLIGYDIFCSPRFAC